MRPARPRQAPAGQPPAAPGRSQRPDRLAEAVHWATLAMSVAFWAWLDRHLWFFGDEWDFLVRRGLSYAPASHRSIWFPHNEHWSTLPVLLWRALYSVFHLGSYWPYLVPLFLAQVGVVHLAWRLSRRNGVDAWVATGAAALLGFLGAGAEDLASAFQVTFVASVFFGFVAFDLLDRPVPGARPTAGHIAALQATAPQATAPQATAPQTTARPATLRNDALASVALLASLMCSTVGDAMVVGAAVLVFARRPRRQALSILALPVASYVVWFAFIGRLGLSSPADQMSVAKVTSLPRYVWFGLSSALGQTANLEAAGAALLVALAVWVVWRLQPLWRDNPALVGLFAAAIAFYVVAGLGRDTTAGASTIVSRYVYVGVAVLLPVIAKALSRPATWPAARWPAARWAIVGLLAVTALGNVGQARTWVKGQVALETSLKPELAATARLLGLGVPDVSGPGASPIGLDPDLSAGSIERLQRSGQLPKASPSPAELATARQLLAIGTWQHARTELTARALFPGRFAFVRAAGVRAAGVKAAGVKAAGVKAAGVKAAGVKAAGSKAHRPVDGQGRTNGCMELVPKTVNPPMQVRLRLPPGEAGASVRVVSSPASPGATNHLAVLLVPRSGPSATSAVQLAIPSGGTGYLSDDDPGTELVLLWVVGTPLELCGLSAR